MLKTNSRQAKQNIREYILNYCTFESYGKEAPEERERFTEEEAERMLSQLIYREVRGCAR